MNEKSEQNIIDYYNLINKIAKIDINAALYLRNEAIDLKNFRYVKDIEGCFVWCSTQQGFDYWHNISNQLEELDRL